MVRRHAGTAFRGAHVFPGGRVDAADGDWRPSDWCDGLDHAARQLPDLPGPRPWRFTSRRCASCSRRPAFLLARRAAGGFVSLADGGCAPADSAAIAPRCTRGTETLRAIAEGEALRLALDALLLFAHWVTPPLPVEGRRFDTRFFMTRVPAGQVPAHDDRETTDGVWMTPRDAIARAVQREIVLPPPTWVTLRELERHPTVDGALAWAAARRVVASRAGDGRRAWSRVLVMPLDDGPDPIRLRAALRAARRRVGTGVRKRTS